MRRSSRSKPKAEVPQKIKLGLATLVRGNESMVAAMLDGGIFWSRPLPPLDSLFQICPIFVYAGDQEDDLVQLLEGVLVVNNLSEQGLLGRFFSQAVLQAYCQLLGVPHKVFLVVCFR